MYKPLFSFSITTFLWKISNEVTKHDQKLLILLTSLKNWLSAVLLIRSSCEKKGTSIPWILMAPKHPRNTWDMKLSSGWKELVGVATEVISDGSRRLWLVKGPRDAPIIISPVKKKDWTFLKASITANSTDFYQILI